jgi:hypothetical protein
MVKVFGGLGVGHGSCRMCVAGDAGIRFCLGGGMSALIGIVMVILYAWTAMGHDQDDPFDDDWPKGACS